jgi:hypothetical protein
LQIANAELNALVEKIRGEFSEKEVSIKQRDASTRELETACEDYQNNLRRKQEECDRY